MKKICLLILAVAFTGQTFAADLKIAMVDLRRAFAEYYKAKAASTKLQENVAKAKTEINERFETYKKLMDEIQKLDKDRNDPILSPEARAKKEAEFRNKAQELRSLEQDINEFKNRRQQQIDEEQRQQAKGLYDEIVKVVNDKAAVAGYDLVLDKSNVGLGGVPFLVYSKTGAVVDFTAEVIVELNKDAPPGAADAPPATISTTVTAPDAPKAEKPADKPSDKPSDSPKKRKKNTN
jgi:outer membrane protein